MATQLLDGGVERLHDEVSPQIREWKRFKETKKEKKRRRTLESQHIEQLDSTFVDSEPNNNVPQSPPADTEHPYSVGDVPQDIVEIINDGYEVVDPATRLLGFEPETLQDPPFFPELPKDAIKDRVKQRTLASYEGFSIVRKAAENGSSASLAAGPGTLDEDKLSHFDTTQQKNSPELKAAEASPEGLGHSSITAQRDKGVNHRLRGVFVSLLEPMKKWEGKPDTSVNTLKTSHPAEASRECQYQVAENVPRVSECDDIKLDNCEESTQIQASIAPPDDPPDIPLPSSEHSASENEEAENVSEANGCNGPGTYDREKATRIQASVASPDNSANMPLPSGERSTLEDKKTDGGAWEFSEIWQNKAAPAKSKSGSGTDDKAAINAKPVLKKTARIDGALILPSDTDETLSLWETILKELPFPFFDTRRDVVSGIPLKITNRESMVVASEVFRDRARQMVPRLSMSSEDIEEASRSYPLRTSITNGAAGSEKNMNKTSDPLIGKNSSYDTSHVARSDSNMISLGIASSSTEEFNRSRAAEDLHEQQMRRQPSQESDLISFTSMFEEPTSFQEIVTQQGTCDAFEDYRPPDPPLLIPSVEESKYRNPIVLQQDDNGTFQTQQTARLEPVISRLQVYSERDQNASQPANDPASLTISSLIPQLSNLQPLSERGPLAAQKEEAHRNPSGGHEKKIETSEMSLISSNATPYNPQILRRNTMENLCAFCQKIRDVTTHDFTHHNRRLLKASAARGCRLCELFYLTVTTKEEPKLENYEPATTLRVVRKGPNLELIDFSLRTIGFEFYGNRGFVGPQFADDTMKYRDIQEDPEHDVGFSIANSWITTCLKYHQRCKQTAGRPLPTRVIDVYDGTRLVDTSNGLTGNYIALSHCWGTEEIIKTEKATLKKWQSEEGILWSSLPKQFQDAIFITRAFGETFGKLYLWVDSLCIIQDAAEDWAHEASRMGDYYRNALLTISALDCEGAEEKILKRRELPDSVELRSNLYLRPASRPWRKVFSEAPLSRRAWVLQERLLSTRILHYGKEEMYWECLTCSTRESSVEEHTETPGNHLVDFQDEDFKRSLVEPNGPEQVLMQWYRIVTQYSGLRLTRDGDKFPALSGLASYVKDQIGYDYVAGLWKQDLHRGLLWFRDTSYVGEADTLKTLPEKRAPTWSWASVHGTTPLLCDVMLESKKDNGADIIRVDVSSSDTNPMGRVADASIRMRVYRKSVQYKGSARMPYNDAYLNLIVDIFDDDDDNRKTKIGTGYLDNASDASDRPRRCDAIYITRTVATESDGRDQPAVAYFLLVARVPEKDEWKRIGIGHTQDLFSKAILSEQRTFFRCPRVVITLI
ncbi:hypothetical protein MMC18_003138 [Xylographa bjoerkii]|nr:hypothetical protein [Xylographa bjoerkii]